MTIEEIYCKFAITPQLKEHQLRVGGVGQVIAEKWKGVGEVETTVRLCLLHDMGNIVKFDLSDSAQQKNNFGKIDNLPYWRQVQKIYRKKYGKKAREATKAILQEGGKGDLIKYIDEEASLYFSEAKAEKLMKASIPAVILMYADLRVKPKGVVPYRERVEDLRKRYGGGKSPGWYEWTREFEKWISSQVKIDLTAIDEQTVRKRWDRLKKITV